MRGGDRAGYGGLVLSDGPSGAAGQGSAVRLQPMVLLTLSWFVGGSCLQSRVVQRAGVNNHLLFFEGKG